MSITEIIHAVPTLSRDEKFQLAQLLLKDLAREELLAQLEGRTFSIFTPEVAPGATAILTQLLKDKQDRS